METHPNIGLFSSIPNRACQSQSWLGSRAGTTELSFFSKHNPDCFLLIIHVSDLQHCFNYHGAV